MHSIRFVLLLGGALLAAQDGEHRLRSLVEQAQLAERQDRIPEAISLYQQILLARPGWASAELNLGLLYHSRRDYNKAIEALSDALRHDPRLHSGLLFRGASYYHIGRFDEAAIDLKEYLKYDNSNVEALSYLANSQLARNDAAEAALAYAVMARVTENPETYFQLVECYVQLARAGMSRLSGDEGRSYRALLAGSDKAAGPEPCEVPGDIPLTNARCAADRGDFEDATRRLTGISRTSTTSGKRIYSTIRAYRRLAQAAAGKLVSIAPDSTWAALLRAQSADQSGQTEDAEKEFERAIAAPGAGLESYARFGQFHSKHGRYDRALAMYEKARTFEPANSRVIGLAGEVHVLQDQPAKAIPLLQASLQANPRETQTRLYLAQSLIRLGRIPEGIRILEEATEDPDGRIHYLLGRTYQQQGETGKARRAMEVFRQRRAQAVTR